jgi:hypothetical protein
LTFPVDPETLLLREREPTIEKFCSLSSRQRLELPWPIAAQLELYTDGSERGGATEARVTPVDESGSSLFEGHLRGVVTETGQRVGFAGVRLPLVLLPQVSKLSFRVEASDSLKLRAVFGTASRQVEGLPGTLSYQALLAPSAEAGFLEVDLSDLRPFVRGRELPWDRVPPFRSEDVESFALELKLSEQAGGQLPEGVHFSILLSRRAAPEGEAAVP